MDTQLPYTGKEFLDSLDDGREVPARTDRATPASKSSCGAALRETP